MHQMEILGYIASIFIGLVLGLLGSGGSILSIPILVYLFEVDVVLASAYSLFIVGVTSLVGAVPKYKDQFVDLRTGMLFGVPSIVSIFLTRLFVVPSIPEIIWQSESFVFTKRILLLGLFAILMILASLSMIKGGLREIKNEEHRVRVFLVIIEGILIGFPTGLVGAGGGFLIIPALVLLTGLNFKTAVGTSLFIIAINSLSGFIGDALNYTIDWFLLLSVTLAAVVGILIGNHFSTIISATTLKKMFGWLTLIMGCWILWKEILKK